MRITGKSLILGTLAAATVAALSIVGQARSQINASPSWVPIGVSGSGSNSVAWFHEPSTRQAVACLAVQSQGTGLTGVQCVSGKLP